MKKTAEETHFLMRYPEEIAIDHEREKQLIKAILEDEGAAWFTVFDGDKVVGNCSIACYRNHIKVRHRCSFAIAIEQSYCGSGLGTILMKRAIDKAKELGFEQMELGVYADNDKGLALYKKMGFEECGKALRAFRLKDGTYIDEINMVLFL